MVARLQCFSKAVAVVLGTFLMIDSDLEAQPRIGGSYRIYPSGTNQSECFLVVHPNDPDILFASANTVDFTTGFISEGIYTSTDGGQNWSGSDTCSGAPINFHNGDPGIAIDANGTFIMTRLGFVPGLYSHYSTDLGQSWSGQYTIASNDQERAGVAADNQTGSAHYGRTYATWTRFAPPYPVLLAYTEDGRTWTTPVQVNNPDPSRRGLGGEIAIGPGGEVYLTWARLSETSPYTEDKIGFAASSSGGQNWQISEHAIDINGISGIFPEKANIRVNGLPRIAVDTGNGPRRGWIYIVTTQRNLLPAGTDPDIILYRSEDGGQSWSGGIRVNQDPLNNGSIQYFPVVQVDERGGLNVLYYDDRNTTSDSSSVFLARSLDGGDTWQEYDIAGHHFQPQPIGGLGQGYQGDNIALASSDGTLWPLWMDNSTGHYQLWTNPIAFSVLDIAGREEPAVPGLFSLVGNYPNPFNGQTRITFSLPRTGEVSLAIYNVRGQQVFAKETGPLEAGDHEIGWNPGEGNLPSGVYLFRLGFGGQARAGKMLYVK
ncbi:MAG TPA: T9SS type A sorting domain-containing protein [Calditrichia bacterium]|nr:T9SS type A sorting domain-containing protein [Calditrichota bacterium]HQU74551.1 T9SS type A sorting domain-containing protein [Calditrichia bacterium]HQV33408.1 T9SS type A sorting domain-containing protein [Calditrichia bacterium]